MLHHRLIVMYVLLLTLMKINRIQFHSQLKIHTTLGYIVSQIIVYIFNYKMFHQEASVETIKMFIHNSRDYLNNRIL